MVMQGQRGESWEAPLPSGSMPAQRCSARVSTAQILCSQRPEWGWGCQRKEEGAGLASPSPVLWSSFLPSPRTPGGWMYLLLSLSTQHRRNSGLSNSKSSLP